MIRKVIKINAEKCTGCALCVSACHEGAIVMEGGKAKLLRDDYCDGLGDCLPACPAGAISFEEREAAPYDQAAVQARLAKKNTTPAPRPGGCPGASAQMLKPHDNLTNPGRVVNDNSESSQLKQWPVQIRLVAANAPYFAGADLVIAADCTAYACGDFHHRFMRDKITLIGCPKLDDANYADKLLAIMQNNHIKSVTLVRMMVPCCGGLEKALEAALTCSGKKIPWRVVVLAQDGAIMQERQY